MQSKKEGGASYVLKESGTAIVTHCCSHNLNLLLAASWKLPKAENILETYKAVIIFFNTSPKREGLLEYISQHRCVRAKKAKHARKVMQGQLLRTWHFLWTFLPCNIFVVEALEIINDTYPEKYLQRWIGSQKNRKKHQTTYILSQNLNL